MSGFLSPKVDVVDHPNGHTLVVGDVATISALDGRGAPAAAAQIASLLVDLGHICALMGFVGDDEAGLELRQQLQQRGVSLDILAVTQWPTYTIAAETAVSASEARGETPEQQRTLPFNGMSEYQAHLQNRLERAVRNAAMLIVADQGFGSIGDPRAAVFAAKQSRLPCLVLCAPHQTKHYGSATRVVEVAPILTAAEGAALGRWVAAAHAQFTGLATE